MPTEARNERILILAPTGRDAELARAALTSAGLVAETAEDIDALCHGIGEGCGAAILTEEALDTAAMRCLREELEKQPAWSDLPLLIFTSRPTAELGYVQAEDKERALAAGFDVHLTKPPHLADLQNVLRGFRRDVHSRSPVPCASRWSAEWKRRTA